MSNPPRPLHTPLAAIHVRSEIPQNAEDAAAVRFVQRAAFPTQAEARLLDALQRIGAYDPTWSLLAEVVDTADDRPASSSAPTMVGHCLLTAATLVRSDGSTRGGRIMALGPIAVLPAWQRRGVGSALMRAALAKAEAAGLSAVVLLGHKEYYPRFGFQPARAQGLHPPAAWSDAAWMAIRLSAWTPDETGTVQYAPPFMTMGDDAH